MRVRRVRHEIPHISACENVGAYSREQIQQIATHLRTGKPWSKLHEASNSWQTAGESLELVSDTLRRVSEVMASGWRSQDAAAAQATLQRLDATARHLAQRTREMSTYTREAGTALANGAERFPTDEPGFFERNLNSAALDRINPFHSGPSDDDYRRALSSLNSDLQTVNTMLPGSVSGEFAELDSARWKRVKDDDDETGTDGGGVPPTSGDTPSYAGDTGPAPGGVPAAPTGGASSAGSVPVVGRLEDGSTGGLAGAAAAPPAAGVGASAGAAAAGAAGVPAGAAGTAGTANAGLFGAGTGAVSAGAGRALAGQPGLVGGGRTASAGAASGAGVRGAGAGRGAGTPGVVGGQPGARGAAGRGAGAGRAGSGATGAPLSRGARRQDRDGSGRDSWLSEDEDLWRDPDAAPSVIE